MAAPLFFMLGATVLRTVVPAIGRELTKLGAKKVSQKVAQEAGKKVTNVTSNNLGTIRTVARPKSGGGATKTATETAKKTAPKTSPKTSGTTKAAPKPKADAKPKADTKPKPSRTQGRKKKAPELKADPKKAPDSVKARAAAKKKAADKKPDVLGGKVQRGLIAVATTAPFMMDTKPKQTAKADSGGRRITSTERAALSDMGGQGKKEETFGQAFKKAYAKGVGTKFSHGGKDYVAVKDSDVKKAGAESLRDYLNKKAGKAKGGYASKNNKGANDYRMGGMLMSVQDRRRMK
jgi:hypothetical protein